MLFGYPVERLTDVPAGTYYVQALLHKYETFHLQTGHTVKLPMDRGEGQHWNTAPGNIYSTPVQVYFDPAKTKRDTLGYKQGNSTNKRAGRHQIYKAHKNPKQVAYRFLGTAYVPWSACAIT